MWSLSNKQSSRSSSALFTAAVSLIDSKTALWTTRTLSNTLNHCPVIQHKYASRNTTTSSPLCSLSFLHLDNSPTSAPSTSSKKPHLHHFEKMDASSSTLKARDAIREQFANISASQSETPRTSPSTDGVNQEPHMRWPPPTLFPGQNFNMPFQQQASNPLLAFARLQEKYKQQFQTHYGHQATPLNPGGLSSCSSSKSPELNQYSSFDQEQRVSASIHILHHVQNTLQQRHHETQMHLARTEQLIEQTAWDLFSQSPLDFLCHEMDILIGPATIGALTGGMIVPKAQSVRESETWMRKLDVLRDLQDDECAAKKRMEKTMRQMKRTDEMMIVGNLKLQELSSQRRTPFGGPYSIRFHNPFSGAQTMAFSSGVTGIINTEGINMAGNSKSTAYTAPSTFSNWPRSGAPQDVNHDEASSINATDSSSTGSSSRFEANCGGHECCGHRGQ